MKNVSYILVGATGRMGQAIQELEEQYNFTLHKAILRGAEINDLDASNVDICIDFSSPEACEQALELCINKGFSFLSGTTGISDDLKQKIKEAGQQIPVLWAPNTSLGVTFFRRLLLSFENLRDWDYQVIESHHNQKLDKPSGTAVFLQQQLEKTLSKKLPETLSIRGGGIFGEHSVLAMAEEEVIEIKHTALNRKLFARGALVAARFLSDKGPGFYTMDDVLDQL